MSEHQRQLDALQQGVTNDPSDAAPAPASAQTPGPAPDPAALGSVVSPPMPVPPGSQFGHPPAQQFNRFPPHAPMGRRYGFLCSHCSSRLEAVESMAGQTGTCPTCGESIVIPILDSRGRLIDPTSGLVIKQDPHPVHAYAAAGHKAPQILTNETSGERYIKCPRCTRNNSLSANNCLGCGLPFTMEGTVGDAISGTNTWAVASLVLGIVSIPGACFVIPPILAIVFGFLAMRGTNSATGKTSGQGLAIAGMILGTLGLLIAGVMWANLIHF